MMSRLIQNKFKTLTSFFFVSFLSAQRVINIPPSLCRVTQPKGNVSSIICLSQHISEVRDVPLSVFIDKSPILTTKVFYYKDNPKITAVRPDCGFDRYAAGAPALGSAGPE